MVITFFFNIVIPDRFLRRYRPLRRVSLRPCFLTVMAMRLCKNKNNLKFLHFVILNYLVKTGQKNSRQRKDVSNFANRGLKNSIGWKNDRENRTAKFALKK